MISLLAAFQFLTIIPPVIRREFTAQELGQSVGYFPIVGLTIGFVLFGVKSGFELIFPVSISSVLVLVAWLLLTRALHFDGLLDTFDGLIGGFSPERRLEIMKDTQVGAFGVAGGVLLLLTKYTAISSLSNIFAGLVLAPIIGRWAISVAIVLFPYARDIGLGRDIKNNARSPQIILSSLIAVSSTWFIGHWIGLTGLGMSIIVILAWLWFVQTRIPGLTGDIYGATCEIIEAFVLLVFAINV